jgi:hypothetical protein
MLGARRCSGVRRAPTDRSRRDGRVARPGTKWSRGSGVQQRPERLSRIEQDTGAKGRGDRGAPNGAPGRQATRVTHAYGSCIHTYRSCMGCRAPWTRSRSEDDPPRRAAAAGCGDGMAPGRAGCSPTERVVVGGGTPERPRDSRLCAAESEWGPRGSAATGPSLDVGERTSRAVPPPPPSWRAHHRSESEPTVRNRGSVGEGWRGIRSAELPTRVAR